MPLVRIASRTLKVAMVFCSRSLRGCSVPKRTSAFAAIWNTISAPRTLSLRRCRIKHVAFDVFEISVIKGVGQELPTTRRKIVVANDQMPVFEQVGPRDCCR